jgi:signal transduction histidine kinase
MQHMNPKTKALLISIIFSVFYYIADSIIDATSVYKELSFLEVFITAPPYQELYSRLLGIGLILILAIIIPQFFTDKPAWNSPAQRDKKISSDPYLMVGVSNQLRTPLNAIQGFVELLKEPGVTETSKRLYVNHIKTSNNYMLELVNNIADITLIESGGLFLKEQDCDLNDVFTKLYNKYSSAIVEKNKPGLNFVLNSENKNLIILVDSVRLEQVIKNLLENSIAFTNKGDVEFGYKFIEDNCFEFFVKDTGSGFSPDRLDMIYNQFDSVIDNRMTPFDIVSLRINLAKHLVKKMGGELKAKSKLNHGSEFSFQLKVDVISNLSEIEEIVEEVVDGAEVILKTKDVEENKKWSDKTILIAEDVETNFIYLREILSETGINILWAQNGKIACDLAFTRPEIDLILMDILMPEMDGMEAVKIIKKKLPELPVIAQTAYHLDEKEFNDAMQYFSKYLIKPIWTNDLLRALAEILT